MPQKVTVEVPTPPERVVTMMSPGPTAFPVRQVSFLEEKYSIVCRQLWP